MCVNCGEQIDRQGYGFFVDLHNERVRTYWNKRQQVISCRVRSTKKGNAGNFRNNIIDFIYNYNIDDLKETLIEIQEQDHKLIAKKLGFDTFLKEESEMTSKEKQEQFSIAMRIRDMDKFNIIELLGLDNVASTKIRGFYKELFYLKCYMNGVNPTIILRSLYQMELPHHFNPKVFYPELESKETSILNLAYRNEIILIVKGFLEVISANKGSIKLIEYRCEND